MRNSKSGNNTTRNESW